MVQCSFCSGSGVSMGGPGDGFSGLSISMNSCHWCDGMGKYRCPTCNGAGIINNGGIRKAVTE